jgi:hypothetical protein
VLHFSLESTVQFHWSTRRSFFLTERGRFAQAQRRLLEQVHEQALEASDERYTVADAVRDYVEFVQRHRKSADDTEQKLTAYVLPQLGELIFVAEALGHSDARMVAKH